MTRAPRDPRTEIPIEGLGAFAPDFLISRKEDLATLYALLEKGDFEAISRTCHTWKGFAVPYGFGELAYLAEELEEACLTKDALKCRGLLVDIADYLSSK